MLKSRSLSIPVLLVTTVFGSLAYAGKSDSSTSTLSDEEVSTIQFMREEEKLARDVYLTLDQYWGEQTQVFANIAESEEEHTSSVEYLIDKYEIEDPVLHDEIGLFTHPELQELYDKLVATGTNSLIDGLYVGGLIEEKDMEDIVEAIEGTDERPLVLVYSNLLDGSENHLRAFVEVIENQDLTYDAQLLSQDEVDYILTADSDSGGKKR
ncbi:DUF2202 domain-containing protein [Marinobacterium sp. YM272]|uniref:DUF2202 domain-containing protein n=1 Tax=Marinobacterium sp. YM272 TaxID=3421654 RepID=UPI003D7F53CF